MVCEGADLLDIGGESTRPGARPVPLDQELARVLPVVTRLAKRVAVPISVDTSKAEVARQAIDAGASMINDVTALRADGQMARSIAQSKAAVILMHMQGNPRTMQRRPRYHDVVRDVAAFLRETVDHAEAAGIARSRLLVDPGLGFGKTVRHNLQLLSQLEFLMGLGVPVVIGPSRKSFIGRTLTVDVDQRLAGTLACVGLAQRAGVHMVRVHDVRPTVQFLTMLEAIERSHATWREH